LHEPVYANKGSIVIWLLSALLFASLNLFLQSLFIFLICMFIVVLLLDHRGSLCHLHRLVIFCMFNYLFTTHIITVLFSSIVLQLFSLIVLVTNYNICFECLWRSVLAFAESIGRFVRNQRLDYFCTTEFKIRS